MDRRVVEFWLSLPAEQLMRRGWPKALLRRASDGLLPADVVWNTANENLGRAFTLSAATKRPILTDRAPMDDDPLAGIIGQASTRLTGLNLAGDVDGKDLDLAAMMLWADHKAASPCFSG